MWNTVVQQPTLHVDMSDATREEMKGGGRSWAWHKKVLFGNQVQYRDILSGNAGSVVQNSWRPKDDREQLTAPKNWASAKNKNRQADVQNLVESHFAGKKTPLISPAKKKDP